MDEIIKRLSQPDTIVEDVLPVALGWAGNIAMAILILIIGFTIAGWLARTVRRLLGKTDRVDPIIIGFLSSLVRYTIIGFTIVAVLGEFGIETTSIIAVFGAAGLAIGLALQGTLSHLAAGVMLLFFRPFKVGDFVEVGSITGTVKDITLFTTELATLDNKKVIVPNGQIWGSAITNYAANGTRRCETVMGISYDDDIGKAQEVMRSLISADERVLADPPLNIVVTSLGDSAVNITAYYWTAASDFFGTRMDMNKALKLAFDKEGINIPYPHRTVYQHTVSGG
ncbi:MAG: mechanosensitive ion channel domain-containing protein [Pseudomonadota bacterium]